MWVNRASASFLLVIILLAFGGFVLLQRLQLHLPGLLVQPAEFIKLLSNKYMTHLSRLAEVAARIY